MNGSHRDTTITALLRAVRVFVLPSLSPDALDVLSLGAHSSDGSLFGVAQGDCLDVLIKERHSYDQQFKQSE